MRIFLFFKFVDSKEELWILLLILTNVRMINFQIIFLYFVIVLFHFIFNFIKDLDECPEERGVSVRESFLIEREEKENKRVESRAKIKEKTKKR